MIAVVKIRLKALATLLSATVLLCSCETTSDGYGHYVSELSEDTVLEFFALRDEVKKNLDFDEYKYLHSPSFVYLDKTKRPYTHLYGRDYFDSVEDIFASASYIDYYTYVMDIAYSEDRASALVTTQEEERRRLHGREEHFSSHLETELGFEDGWIFIKKVTRTDSNKIR